MSVLGYSRNSRSYVGLRASAMALALVSARYPQPSRMTRTRGLGRDIKLLQLRILCHGFTRMNADRKRQTNRNLCAKIITGLRDRIVSITFILPCGGTHVDHCSSTS